MQAIMRQQLRQIWHKAQRWLAGPKLHGNDIARALQSFPFDPPKTLLVHSSLSSLGYVVGGANTIITVLRDWNLGGTLAMPAHSYCYPDDCGSAPVFDSKKTSSRVGAITDAFWRQSGVQRSIHPTHSLSSQGPEASALLAGHELCDTPCGRGTPYERLALGDTAVLMFGATLDSYTLFHTAEDAAKVPYLYMQEAVNLRFVDSAGSPPRVMKMKRQDMGVMRRFRDMVPWFEERGLLHRAGCGLGELLFIPHAAGAHEKLVQALLSDPWLLVEPSARAH